MLVDFTRVKNIFIVCGRTDMRKGIDGLASIVQYEYDMDLYDNAIFLFCGGKSDRFKALYWDGDGFILLYKRINDGKLKWPRKSEEIMKLSNQQLRWLLGGEDAISEILKDFTGYAHTDGYSVYESLIPNQKVGCLAHVRRYFIEADVSNKKGQKTLACEFVERLGEIFHLDHSFEELNHEQRKRMRLHKIKPLLDRWYQDLEVYRTKKANSKFEKAVNYAFNQREAVYRIFEYGALELTNNRAERAVKEIDTGRKNWLFSKNGKGARVNAIYQSLIMTAEVNGLSPWKYLEWLLSEIKELEAPIAEDFARYLPWSKEAQDKCKIGSICTEKYQHYFKKET